MACGSGKTLVSLWGAESFPVRTVVVFAPTLGLLAQLAREWLANSRWDDIGCLAVCSDSKLTEGFDEIRPAPEECPFAVASDKASIRDYLDSSSGDVKWIFCTYQSADILASALGENEYIDFGIFDEAHRTAGKIGTLFSFALSDERLRIRKRLFMTATPRVYTRGPASIRELGYSMDHEQHYGRTCAGISFAESVARGVICPYKVVLSIINSGALAVEQLHTRMMEEEDLDVRTAATRESFVQAVETYNIGKIITFHSTIERAREFVEKDIVGVLPEHEKLHISSEMSGDRRRAVMKRFAESPKALLSNARCLTEGIDVPSVDMVAFMDPKESEIDIVQAVGRAMRTNDEKMTGYIFVPLFLDQRSGEPLEEALKRSRYETVWDVLRAIYSFDEELQQHAALWRQDFGYTGQPHAFSFIDSVDVLSLPRMKLDELKRSVGIFIAEELSNVWDEHYGQLVAFRDANGHIDVPVDQWLYGWIKSQRRFWDKRLTLRQKDQLLKIGFDPQPRKTLETKYLGELRIYAKEHGHCNITGNDNPTLFKWLGDQRRKYHKGTLPANRVEELNAIGIQWDDFFTRLLHDTLQKYDAYCKEHGHPVLSSMQRAENAEERLLIARILKLRVAYREGKLTEEQIEACEKAGLDLDPRETRFKTRYEELTSLVAAGKDPNRVSSSDPLYGWLKFIRKYYAQGQLEQDKVDKLKALGVDMDRQSMSDTDWNERFVEVKHYFETNDVQRLPTTHSCYNWWKWQLKQLEDGKVSAERADLMKSLNPKRSGRRWSAKEKQIIRQNPHLTASALEELLPGRNTQSIQKIRDRFGW